MAEAKERSLGVKALPKSCRNQMAALGENIRLARIRRKIRQEDMAKRIAISVKTYRKIENGDATVAMGLYLSALFMLGLSEDFSALADPAKDRIGLSMERRNMPERIRLQKDKALDF
ncbi:MAG: helix-turn-helix transcriptional regulator [Methylomonas sp.]|jgi:transcriptional regulator with XRE-family HTH domain